MSLLLGKAFNFERTSIDSDGFCPVCGGGSDSSCSSHSTHATLVNRVSQCNCDLRQRKRGTVYDKPDMNPTVTPSLDELEELGLPPVEPTSSRFYRHSADLFSDQALDEALSPIEFPLQARISEPAICKLRSAPPQELEATMETYGRSLMYYYLALEMRELSDRLLSHMDISKDDIFGDGTWLSDASNRQQLDDEQREHVERAMANFDNIYRNEWRILVEKLFKARGHC
ncbi:hypothetical protein BKA70DRAFT_1421822 [Coprinopsis sp. MPI-PUGE-AT-0042]|nr:hypothetical protein BKA70DRAFT_1421822 [Coprinopsis sp. MPI-PUGE-AT-0042]